MEYIPIQNINNAVRKNHIFWDNSDVAGSDAADVPIIDTNEYYDATDVEAALAEIYSELNTLGIWSLTADEVTQLQNIDTTTISITQWGYVGSMNQNVSTTQDVTFNSVTLSTAPSSGTNAATKDYVDAVAQAQKDYQESVDDFWDASSGLPISPSTGDRYICSVAGNGWTQWYIYEYNSVTWDETVIDEGAVCWVEDEDIKYIFNGTSWVKFGTTVVHNNLSSIQGSTDGYHISSTQYTNILLKTDSVTDLSDVSAVGSGSIITAQERTDINASVTVHNDVTSAGSGIIISGTERTNFGTAYTHSGLTTGNPHQVNKSDVGLGNVDNIADASQVSLGTVTSGDVRSVDSLGKLASKASGDIFYWTTALQRLAKGNDGQYLKLASGIPSWDDVVVHDAVTLGTPANGLSLDGQEISLGLASTSTTGALSDTDWNTFNGKQASGSYLDDNDFTADGLMKRTGSGTYTTITDSSSNWDTAYSHSQITTGNPHSLDAADVGAATSDHTQAVDKGGTNITSYASGDILYASGSTVLAKLAKSTDGKILKLASGIPSWADEYVNATGDGLSYSSGTLSLGTPTTLTSATSNNVTGTTHTHAVTTQNITSSTAGILKTNGSTKAAGTMYTGSTDPDGTTRVNMDCYLYATKVYNAVYNDYADYFGFSTENPKYGYCYSYSGYKRLSVCRKRSDKAFAGIATDTSGFNTGSKNGNVPLSVAGFTLAYVNKPYKTGTPLVPNRHGVLTKARFYERPVAIFLFEEYEDMYNDVEVNGRCWVKII